MPSRHKERHSIKSIGWLRAAVLGANDGIVSTSSLVLGVAAAHATHCSILIAGVDGDDRSYRGTARTGAGDLSILSLRQIHEF